MQQEGRPPSERVRDHIAAVFYLNGKCLGCPHPEMHHTEYFKGSYLLYCCAEDGCPCLVYWPLG